MAVQIPARFRSLATIGLLTLAGCYSHSYGLTLSPSPGYYTETEAEQFLKQRGFSAASASAGDVLSMERRRADSVDHVRIFRGGGSPGLMGSYGTVGSGGGAYTYNPASAGVAQSAAAVYGFLGGYYSPPGRPSGSLTIELRTFKVDARGGRHAVEPPDAALDELDALIDLVQQPPPVKH